MFAPWVREKDALVRLFSLRPKRFVLATVNFKKAPPTLVLTLESKTKLEKSDKQWLVDMLSWNFAIDENVREFYQKICKKDKVLRAACDFGLYGAHLRTDPYVFESVIGVVLAQNVRFQRLYKMQRLLCEKFGEKAVFRGKTYYAFPIPECITKARFFQLRACKVGYRDKYLKAIAQKIVKEKIDLDSLRKSGDTEAIRNKLMELPGVGPYTADLAMAIGFRLPTFHIDLFSREALTQFYFKGENVSDEKLRAFVEKRWGKWKQYVMLLLTTNTDMWAKRLGKKFRLTSGATSAPHNP
ncbi:MAG: hypothetical protein A2Z96_05600 [Spirochaetes bacterium GWB1_48_6]|nr:MAG: hypothetical protein A2Z96_05600 [Spirochaetes bacterium GWB1_48_6]